MNIAVRLIGIPPVEYDPMFGSYCAQSNTFDPNIDIRF